MFFQKLLCVNRAVFIELAKGTRSPIGVMAFPVSLSQAMLLPLSRLIDSGDFSTEQAQSRPQRQQRCPEFMNALSVICLFEAIKQLVLKRYCRSKR